MLVKYSSNNSGGSWWLTDEDWINLEKAGWTVEWYRSQNKASIFVRNSKDGRFLGALATSASKDFPSVKDAIKEFVEVTKQDPTDDGCECCGPPHSFSWEKRDGEFLSFVSGSDCSDYY